jgi:terminase, large subunit
MDAFTEPRIERITWMKSARVGFTKCLNNIIGYHIHQDPSSILVVQPTVDDAKGYSKDEIAPMLRDTPALRGLVAEPRSRDSGNTIDKKLFPGGTLTLIGANSARGFRRLTVRLVLFDEVDGYPPTAGQEGDQISLGIKRSDTFWNRKIALGSTPTVKGASRIETSFEASDGGYYYVPCPHCQGLQTLKWRNLKWPEGRPKEAYFVCEHCGEAIEHRHKRRMIEGGEWRGKSWRYRNGKFELDPEFEGHIGFHCWAAYSYSPNAAWGKLAVEFLDVHKDRERLRTFANTVWGETWEEDQGERPDWASLQARAEPYHVLSVPAGGLFLTAGIDVQDDRLAVVIVAWGRGEESWRVYWGELYGDPSQPGGVWAQLDDLLQRGYEHESGALLHVTGAMVDSGHLTNAVYNYARTRAPRIVAVKGMGQLGRPIITRPGAQDVQYKGTIIKNGVMLWSIGVDGAKRQIYHRLKIIESGPGHWHFPIGLPEEYYEQLTAEKLVTRYKHGVPYGEWIQLRPRNEAIDCEVYAYAAAIRAGMGRLDWGRLEQGLALRAGTDAPTVPPPVTAQPPGRRVRSRGI